MASAPSPSKLGARDRDDFDALFAQKSVGVCVAIVCKYDTRRGADEIGSAVPLRAFPNVGIPTRLHHTQQLNP